MKYILFVLLILFTFSFSLSQNKKLISDSLKKELINERIRIKQEKTIADSLSREILFYRVKEDYYSSALDRQGSHYEFLYNCIIAFITIFLAGGAFFSFKFFGSSIEKLKLEWETEINNQKIINESIVSDSNKLKKEVYYQLSFSIADAALKRIDVSPTEIVLNHYLKSIRNMMQAYLHADADRVDIEGDLFDLLYNGTSLSEKLLKEISKMEEDDTKVKRLKKIQLTISRQRIKLQEEMSPFSGNLHLLVKISELVAKLLIIENDNN